MDAQIWTALIGGVVVLLGAVAGYVFTKKQEREALLRQQKLEYYKEFALTLTGILRDEDTPEGHRAFNRVCNSLNLIAPQPVLAALQAFRREIRASNPNRSDESHDKLLSELFLEIRKDLGVSPADDEKTFRVRLWASGQPPARK